MCSGAVVGGFANASTHKKKKQTKHYFKTTSQAETHLWLKCINQYTMNLDDDLQTEQVLALAESERSHDGDHPLPQVQPASTAPTKRKGKKK